MRSVFFIGLMLVTSATFASPLILHSDTFEAGDSQSWVDPWFDPSNPITVGPNGLMDSSSLLFGSGNQIEYATPAGYLTGSFNVEFDLLTTGLIGTVGYFRVLIDSPTVQTLTFDGDEGLQIYTSSDPHTGGPYMPVGSFSDNELMHVEFSFNMPANTWLVNINGTDVYNNTMYGSGFTSIRFASAGATAYLDNVSISTVPIPAAAWLFGSALAGLGWLGRKLTV